MLDHDSLLSFLTNFLVVGASSSVAKTLTAPLDRIKLILQSQKSASHIVSNQRQQYNSFSDCLIRLPKEQGILSFWRGNGTNVLRYIPTQALNFAFNEFFANELNKLNKSESKGVAFVAGGFAGFATVMSVYPLKVCQTRISLDMGSPAKATNAEKGFVGREYNGLYDCLKKVLKRDGVTGVYRGLSLGLASSTAFRCLYFGLFDLLKKEYRFHQKEVNVVTEDNTKLPIWVSFFIAQIVTITAGLAVYPFDTIGRRYMLEAGRKENQRAFPGPWKAFKVVYTNEGYKGFYRGAITNCMRGICGALILVFYEEFSHYYYYLYKIKPSKPLD